MRLAGRLLAAWLAICAVPALAQRPFVSNEGTPTIVIEQADFVVGSLNDVPPDSAPWQSVRLPDNWYFSHPGLQGVGWYRITLPVSAPRRLAYNMHLPRNTAIHIGFFVNGQLIGGTAGTPDPLLRLSQQPLLYAIPPLALRAGENRLYIRVAADANYRQGLTRVTLGEPDALRAIFLRRARLQLGAFQVFGFAAFIVGVAALVIWLRRRSESMLFWFGLAAGFAGLPAIGDLFGDLAGPGPGRAALLSLYAYAFSPALAVASLRASSLRVRWFEASLWLLLAFAVLDPLVFGAGTVARDTGTFTVAFFAALTVTLLILIARASRHDRVAAVALAASHACAIAFGLHDWAQWEGWIDYDSAALFQFAPPVLMFGLGAVLVSRHFRTIDELATINRELEERVAERSAEIERTYAQMRELERVQAAVRERQRIMADMHDGLGASLVSLLSVVQAGKAAPVEIERRVHGVLQELRLAVDSLDTPEGDLAMALGTVRHRLRESIEAAGVEFDWQVGELPRLDDLTPTKILHVQRIVLEALTNAMRHSGAKRVSVATRVDAEAGQIELSIADDGRGFASGAQGGGRGLMTMQRRAAALGGRLVLESRPGGGTRILLLLPLRGPAA
jgi:signal transduction histidine kinase